MIGLVTSLSPHAPVAQSIIIIPVSTYTRHRSVLRQAEWWWWGSAGGGEEVE